MIPFTGISALKRLVGFAENFRSNCIALMFFVNYMFFCKKNH